MRIAVLDLKREYIYMKDKIDERMRKVVSEAKYIMGEEVEQFEEKFRNYIGSKFGLGVGSGTDALVIGLRSIAYTVFKKQFFDKDDIIITTPFTFTATGEAILRAGATPLFLDVERDSYNIDLDLLERFLKENYRKEIKGIVVVHLFGNPVDMDRVLELANRYNLFVVEDCAQATGSKWRGRMVGSFGNVGAFSFFPTKNLGGFGDGGFITTDDPKIYEVARMLRVHGGKDKYNVELIGYNSRLDTVQAGVLLAKFDYLEEFLDKRRKNASYYNDNLKDISWITLPASLSDSFHTYNQYTIRVLGGLRDRLKERLDREGIQTMIYYRVPLHRMRLFKERAILPYPLEVTEELSQQVLSLPIEPLLNLEELRYVVDRIRNFLNRD